MTDGQTEMNALNMNVEVVDLEELQDEKIGRDVNVSIAETEESRQQEVLPDVRQVWQ